MLSFLPSERKASACFFRSFPSSAEKRGSCMLWEENKNGRKRGDNLWKGRIKRVGTHPLEARSRVTEQRRNVTSVRRVKYLKEKSLFTFTVVLHADASSVPNRLIVYPSSGELLRSVIPACSALIFTEQRWETCHFSCSGAIYPLVYWVLKQSSGYVNVMSELKLNDGATFLNIFTMW